MVKKGNGSAPLDRLHESEPKNEAATLAHSGNISDDMVTSTSTGAGDGEPRVVRVYADGGFDVKCWVFKRVL